MEGLEEDEPEGAGGVACLPKPHGVESVQLPDNNPDTVADLPPATVGILHSMWRSS